MFKLFGVGKNTVKGTHILVATVGKGDEGPSLLKQDIKIYQDYMNIDTHQASTAAEFIRFLSDKVYDVVHIHVSFDANGKVDETRAIQILERMSKSQTKVVIFATAQPIETYAMAFPRSVSKPFETMNQVLTLDRKGDNFVTFFCSLFHEMSRGKPMPIAWTGIMPQHDGPWMEKAPSTIFNPNRGSVTLLP